MNDFLVTWGSTRIKSTWFSINRRLRLRIGCTIVRTLQTKLNKEWKKDKLYLLYRGTT